VKVLLHYGRHIDEHTIKENIPPPEIEIGIVLPSVKIRFLFGGRADGMPLYRLMRAK